MLSSDLINRINNIISHSKAKHSLGIFNLSNFTTKKIPSDWNSVYFSIFIENNKERQITGTVERGTEDIGTYLLRIGYYVGSGNNAAGFISYKFNSNYSLDILNATVYLNNTDYTNSSTMDIIYYTSQYVVDG